MRFPSFFILILTLLATGCAPQPKTLPALEELVQKTDDEVRSYLGLETAQIGYHLIDVRSGATIAQRRQDRAFPPASTAKLPTMIAALDILGPDFRFRTRLGARGTLKDGTLDGDLVLFGDGDPLLSSGDLRALAVRLRDIGVRRITGQYNFHSVSPSFTEISENQPQDAPYNQGVAGLNIDFNRVHVDAVTGRPSPFQASGLIGTPASGVSTYADRPVREPARLAATLLRAFARAEGIDLPTPTNGAPPTGTQRAAEVVSQPLLEIARAGLEYSNNLVAEAIGLAAAERRGAAPETLAESALVLGIWLEDRIPTLRRFAQNQHNHSGLSAKSRITPKQMTAILRYGLTKRYGGWRIDSLLPPGGGREGYRGRFRQAETAFRVWGKTGSMRYIKGIAGYLDAKSGRKLAFAIYTFDPEKRAAWKDNRQSPPLEQRSVARRWRDRVELFEAAKITDWISNN